MLLKDRRIHWHLTWYWHLTWNCVLFMLWYNCILKPWHNRQSKIMCPCSFKIISNNSNVCYSGLSKKNSLISLSRCESIKAIEGEQAVVRTDSMGIGLFRYRSFRGVVHVVWLAIALSNPSHPPYCHCFCQNLIAKYCIPSDHVFPSVLLFCFSCGFSSTLVHVHLFLYHGMIVCCFCCCFCCNFRLPPPYHWWL